MNKNRLSSWVLVFLIATLFGATAKFAEYSEPTPLAYVFFLVPFALALLLLKLRIDVRKEREAAARAVLDRQAAEAQRRADLEADVRRIQERYLHVRFPVAGVTFQNPDKTDRQKILLEISFNDVSETDVWFEEEGDNPDEDPAIRVMTDYGCVGYIRRSDKTRVRRMIENTITTKYLSVEQFVNDEGKAIYRADVIFVIDRQSPNQQWYFDDLPES